MTFCKFLDKKFGNVIFFSYICARKKANTTTDYLSTITQHYTL